MRDVLGVTVVALAISIAAGACSPLPGASLDPLYLTTPAAAPAPATTARAPAAAPAPRVAAVSPGAAVWSGRYTDSRGDGEMTLSIVRTATGIAGTWRLRTGGGGRLTGTAQPGGSRLALHMETGTAECPAELDGWIEIADAGVVGAYHGKDCDGAVADGRFDLRPR